MKKYLNIIFIALLTISLTSCATLFGEYSTINTNNWLKYEILPSKILRNGEVFFEGKLSDGKTFSVFQDDKIDIDQYYYYNSLYQDFGWYDAGDMWKSSGNYRRVKLGYIYINPKRGAAVYLYPKGIFAAFKVRFNN